MKAVILAGGLGTRISEESHLKPKPMIEIAGRPILWHIMKIYSHYGINDFIICLGYRGYMIKEYFANYFLHVSDITFNLAENKVQVHQPRAEPWNVTLIETGEHTQTGGRLKRVQSFLGNDDFCLTYGDGVSDVAIDKVIEFHKNHGKLATVTAVMPPGRFGSLEIGPVGEVSEFSEKPMGQGGRINGGFFVLSPKVIDYIAGDATAWEREPLTKLAAEGQLMAFEHNGFWQAMDTMRDKTQLERMFQTGAARWMLWDLT
jgi:glucose-1-phosphate cytidylyltransferase